MATARGSDWGFGLAEATRIGKMFTPEALGISPAQVILTNSQANVR